MYISSVNWGNWYKSTVNLIITYYVIIGSKYNVYIENMVVDELIKFWLWYFRLKKWWGVLLRCKLTTMRLEIPFYLIKYYKKLYFNNFVLQMRCIYKLLNYKTHRLNCIQFDKQIHVFTRYIILIVFKQKWVNQHLKNRPYLVNL